MDLGFTAAVWQRALLATTVAGLAGALVLLVEQPNARAAAERPGPVAQRHARLRLESSFPVLTWTVSVAGVPVPARHHDAGGWEGLIEAPVGSEVLIEAVAAAQAQRGALRMVLDGDPQGERTAWGEGSVIATLRLP